MIREEGLASRRFCLGQGLARSGLDRTATDMTNDNYLLTSTTHFGRARTETQLAASSSSSSSHRKQGAIALRRSNSLWLYGTTAALAKA